MKFEANDMLQRNQLKSVFGGGYGSGTCNLEDANTCSSNSDCTSPDKCITFNCTEDDGTPGTYKSCI